MPCGSIEFVNWRDCRALVKPLDHQGLLVGAESSPVSDSDDLDDDELLAQLGVRLRHRPTSPNSGMFGRLRRASGRGNRQQPEVRDFEKFKPLFDQVQKELNADLRQTRRFERKSEIGQGRFYILGGQKAYVAAMEEPFTNEHGNIDARLRVIFDNGTESNLLMRSLQKALQQDPAGRRIIEPSAGPLFADQNEDGMRQAALSMCSAAGPIIPPSRPIAMSCIRSASPAAMSRGGLRMPNSTRRSLWRTSRSWRPMNSSTSTEPSSRT